MVVKLDVPKQDEIENGLKIAAGAAVAIVVLRIATGIADRIHEKKQSRKIKKLESRVSDLEAQVDDLEAQLKKKSSLS